MRASCAGLLAAAAAGLLVAGCGEDQDPWCDQLDSLADLGELATALASGDAESAQRELERFSEAASDAPEAVRDDMVAVADALEQVVGVALTGPDADPDDLELRRESVNDQLDTVSANVSAVSAYAETECGIRLD